MGIKFEFQNLGVLEHASIELKPFTLVCGGNNCGKTYLAYAIYGLFRNRYVPSNNTLFNLRPFVTALAQDGHCDIDLKTYFIDKINDYEAKIAQSYLERYLSQSLAVPTIRLQEQGTQMSIILKDRERVLFEQPYPSKKRNIGNINITISKQPKTYSVSVFVERIEDKRSINVRENSALLMLLNDSLTSLLRDFLFPNVFMASCERTGAVIFRNELNFNKSRLLEAVGEILAKGSNKHINNSELMTAFYSGEYALRYPTPVKDNVDFINQMSDLEKENSFLVDEYPEIIEELDNLVGGTFGVRDGNIVFIDGQENILKQSALNLQQVSSSVKSLVIFAYYLKHIAKKDDLLMIDEPELNLHPSNQRKMARLLAKLVNVGLNVFITTHSDIIAKEINTLLLMNQAGSAYAKKQGYQKNELLKSSDVELYIAEKTQSEDKQNTEHVLRKVEKFEDGGLNFHLFDQNIREMNEVQNNVWEYLMNKGK